MKDSPELERTLLEHFAELLRNQEIRAFEREKNPEELQIISAIIQHVPEFVRNYGGEPVPGLTEQNFHIVDVAKLAEEEKRALERADVGALYDFKSQSAVILPREESRLITAHRMVHELLHLESFTSLNVTNEAPLPDSPPPLQVGATKLSPRRIGFSVFDATQEKRLFRDLDEAIIEELVARFDNQYFVTIPTLSAELARRAEMSEMIARGAHEISAVVSKKDEQGRWETAIEEWKYSEERRKLQLLIKEILEANRESFASEEEIFVLFAKAVFTGRLLKIARLIEKTRGKGSFANLGEQTKVQHTPEKAIEQPSDE